MASKKTVYVIGAGASMEANLPTGTELKDNISTLLDIRFDAFTPISGDRYITEALRIHCNQRDGSDFNQHLCAAWRIRDAMPQAISIDNFIDTHSDDEKIELCGKLAIVRSILQAESKSLLHINNSNIHNKMNFKALESTWYSGFMKLLTENCRKEDLPERLKSIALIIFNYDRCIEHFLFHSLQNYYGINNDDAAALVNQIEIYHPYGTVGTLPWQGSHNVEFGAKPQSPTLLELADDIKTFTEGTDPNVSKIISIRKNVSEAENIVFLGFAFHDLNMTLLSPESITPGYLRVTTCFGTAKGISDSDCEIIRNNLNNFSGNKISGMHINNKLDCTSLFKEYWRSLSLKNS